MPATQIRILIADDDSEDLELIEEHILAVEPRAQLHKFMDGFSAYNFLHSRSSDEQPSLIILDYNMPGLSGSQVLAALKLSDRYSGIPKIVLSTSNSANFMEESLANGALEYIVKPASMKEIHQLAKKLVTLAVEGTNPQANIPRT